jgi:hypothetical protein
VIVSHMPEGTHRARSSPIKPTLRTIARYGISLIGVIFAADRVRDAVWSWRQWRRWAVDDPSAADFFRTEFWIATAAAVTVLAFCGFVFWLLRPPSSPGAEHRGWR